MKREFQKLFMFATNIILLALSVGLMMGAILFVENILDNENYFLVIITYTIGLILLVIWLSLEFSKCHTNSLGDKSTLEKELENLKKEVENLKDKL